MKLTQKITLALGLLAAGASFAQTNTSSSGLLGQRYAEASFGVQDVKNLKPNLYGLGVSANVPLAPGSVDAGVGYSYDWIRGSGVRAHANTVGSYLTAYAPLNGVKPFVSAAVGWQWSHIRGFANDDQGLWGLAAGVEIPAGVVTITPRITYSDDFESRRNSSQRWTYSAEANYWVNAKTGVFASLGFSDELRSPVESWNYSVGLRLKF